MRGRAIPAATGLAAIALLVGAATAAAAPPRVAGPAGSGTACTQAQPCGIVTAINNATQAGEVILEPGTYGSPAPLAAELDDEGNDLAIHGREGQPRPVIVSSAAYAIEVSPGSSLSDVDVEDATGTFGIYVDNSEGVSIDHVISHVSAPKAIACYPTGTLTDSVCWSSGTEGIALTLLVLTKPATATLRNDTLIASGTGGEAVVARGAGKAAMTINLSNSIARGAGTDIRARTDEEPGSEAIVNADHSDYATTALTPGAPGSVVKVTEAGSGSNQTAAPSFVNAAAGDFHEAAGSSATIDRGENSPLDGATDLDGNARALPGYLTCAATPPAAVTDIGAYEYAPVVPPCAPILRRTKLKLKHKGDGVTFTFAATVTPSGYQCRLVKAVARRHKKRAPAFATCGSPKTYKHLRPGSYRFEVRALFGDGHGPVSVKKFTVTSPRHRH